MVAGIVNSDVPAQKAASVPATNTTQQPSPPPLPPLPPLPPKSPVASATSTAAVKQPVNPSVTVPPHVTAYAAAATTPPQQPVQKPAPVPPTEEEHHEDTSKTLPLGQKLLQKGLISKDQLDTALKEQSNQIAGKKKMLGSILVEMGFITESALGEVLSESAGVKNFDLSKAVLDPNLIKRVPKEVATRCRAVPVSIEGNNVNIAITDVYNILAIDQIRRFFPSTLKIVPVYATQADVLEIIDQYYGYEMSVEGILKEIETGIVEKKELSGEAEGYTNPTVRLVDSILVDAIKRGASDIHFEPEGAFLRLRYRIDGQMLQIRSFHKEYWPAIVVRIKILSGMNIAETRHPQDGRTSYFVSGREIDFRVATHPTIHGENIVMRILDKQKALLPLEKLGFSEQNEKILKRMLKRPEGIVIVTGPTGSGKTTTLYSVLTFMNNVNVNIMTLENPVEYLLPMIRQSDIKEDSGMDFVSGIKSLLRQDPDIIFVGEVRDEATANMAMRAAMTGHRVFTTLHTNDSIAAIPRLIDIGIPPHLLAGSLICTLAQRLIRKLCLNCREPYIPNQKECDILEIDKTRPPTLFRPHPSGCEKCQKTGYKGRISVNEIFTVDREMDELIATGSTRKSMLELSLTKGFIPMAQDGIGKILQGVTDLEELIRVVDLTDRL